MKCEIHLQRLSRDLKRGRGGGGGVVVGEGNVVICLGCQEYLDNISYTDSCHLDLGKRYAKRYAKCYFN